MFWLRQMPGILSRGSHHVRAASRARNTITDVEVSRYSRTVWHKVVDPGFIAIPGGHTENEETPEEALRREMREELGIVPNTVT